MRLIPQPEVAATWPLCESMIAQALKYTVNPDIAAIRGMVAEGKADLWQGEKACAITCFLDVQPRLLNILAAAGEDLDEWFPAALAAWVEFAKEYSCAALIASGRPGWRNVFRDNGFKVTHITGMKEV